MTMKLTMKLYFLTFSVYIKFMIKLNIIIEDFDIGYKPFDAPMRIFENNGFRIKSPYGRNLKLTSQYFKLRAFLACLRHQEPQSRDPVDTWK